MQNLRSLVVFLGLVALTSASGALFSPGPWYAELIKPSWTPPNWLFGPVWTVLYILIAVSGWRLWTRTGPTRKPALIFWGAQLVLNALWSALFFGVQRPDLAFVEIVLLWLAIAFTIGLGRRVDGWAAGLLVPYLFWVSFAAALNLAVWRLNPIG